MTQIKQNRQATILSSPLPGRVMRVLAREGEIVKQGQSLFIVESMKMLQVLRAAKTGRMKHIFVREGDIIASHNHLAYLR